MSDAVDHVHCVRAWGIPDRRVASGLAHENQAGQWRRRKTIGRRAAAAGWPVESPNLNVQEEAQKRALRRLEGMDWSHRAQSRHTYKRRVAYESRGRASMVTTSRGSVLPVDDPDAGGFDRDDGPATIFDE